MFSGVEVFSSTMRMAQYAGARQNIAAQNIANVNTPGYRALSLPSFNSIYSQRSNDFDGNFDVGRFVSEASQRINSHGNDNGVVLRDELFDSVGARRQHDRAVTIYQTSISILRAALQK